MKTSLLKYFMLATTLVASISLSAQTYNGGTWYSLYDTDSHTRTSTGNFTEKSVFAPAESITFEYKRYTGISIKGNIEVQNKIGSNWSGSKGSIKYDSSKDWSTSPSFALDEDISHVRCVMTSGNGGQVRNHFVKLKKHIRIAGGDFGKDEESKSFGNVAIGNVSAVQTVKLRSFLTTDNITITSDKAAFRVGSSSNQGAHVFNVGANACASANGVSGTPAGGGTLGDINLYDINIYFVPTAEGEYSGTITISDGTSSATISVSGVGMKKTQTIDWAEALKGDSPTLPIGKKISSPANAKTEITYSIADPTIISINGNTLTALKAGTTTITATATENEEWLSDTSTITVKVTEKKVQYIHWNDNLTRFKVGDDAFTLTATASILIDAENEITEAAPERNQYISYQSEKPAVVSVDGDTLYINGEGETILTAILQGDEEYEEAIATMPVRVRVPSTTVCETFLLNAPDEVAFQAPGGGNYTPAAWTAPAGQLTFEAKISNGTAVGPLEVQQLVNGEWKKIDDFMPKTNWNVYGPYTLDRNATQVRFYSNGSFRRFIKNVLVTQATYLETTAQPITVEKSIIGDEITRTIAIQYSNIPAGVIISNNAPEVVLSDYELGNDCGTHGEKQITVTVRPTSLKTIEDVITIHDEVTGTKLEIPVIVHVQRNTQTITWEQELSALNTTDNITLSAEAETSIYYTSSDSTIAYAEDNHLVINKYGQFTLTAVAVESEKYEQATVTKNVTINIVDPTIIMLPTVDAITYGATFEGATLLGGEANVSGAWQWNDDLNQVLDAGMHNLKVQFIPTNTAWYSVVDTTISVTVNKAAAILATAPIAITDLVYNATAQTLIVAGVAEGGTMQYSLDGASYTSDLPTAISAGTYTVYYKVVADANHTDVEVATLTATIAQAPLTITAEDYNILYGEAAPTYTATYTGWQGSDDAAVLAGTLAYSCDYVAGNNVGTYTITPSGVTAANYAIQFVAGTLTVNQVAAAVATAPIAVTELVYNAIAQTLIDAGVAEGGTMQYSLDGESYTFDLPTAISAGTYTVYYKVVADANHTDVEVATLTATIAQAPLTITAEDYNILYGEAAPTYTATYTGWQGSDDAAVLAGTLAYSCDYVAGNNVGTYTITPSGVTAANYAIQFVAGTLTVNQVAAAVATAPIAITDLVYNATAQTLIVAGVAEGGTMQYSLDGESYTFDLPTAISAGTYTVYYKVVADANHTDVEVATLTATIAQAPQFIEWELTNFVMEVGDTLHLTATATSGLEVTYALDDDTYAEINGNLLTALQVGTFTITASQDGVDGEYANYLAAKPIIETITIVAKNVNTNTEMIFNESKATKIIRDGCLYILRNNRTYNVNGQVVE